MSFFSSCYNIYYRKRERYLDFLEPEVRKQISTKTDCTVARKLWQILCSVRTRKWSQWRQDSCESSRSAGRRCSSRWQRAWTVWLTLYDICWCFLGMLSYCFCLSCWDIPGLIEALYSCYKSNYTWSCLTNATKATHYKCWRYWTWRSNCRFCSSSPPQTSHKILFLDLAFMKPLK